MRRLLPLLVLTLAGCNAPIAAFMDTAFPSHAKPDSRPGTESGPGVDVGPRPAVDPLRPGPPAPAPAPGPLPPPDFGQ